MGILISGTKHKTSTSNNVSFPDPTRIKIGFIGKMQRIPKKRFRFRLPTFMIELEYPIPLNPDQKLLTHRCETWLPSTRNKIKIYEDLKWIGFMYWTR